jgi:hypothetical protein
VDIIRLLAFYSKHEVWETGSCLPPQEEPTQLGSVYRVSLSADSEIGTSSTCNRIIHANLIIPTNSLLIRRDLQIPTVKEEICRYSSQYSARLSAHPNVLIVNLKELPDNTRL